MAIVGGEAFAKAEYERSLKFDSRKRSFSWWLERRGVDPAQVEARAIAMAIEDSNENAQVQFSDDMRAYRREHLSAGRPEDEA